EVLGLVGESGSGKSVSALAILRLLPPQARIQGTIQFRGEDLLAIPEPQMRHIRGAGISMIFQEPMTALNPVMRVGDQIAEAVLAHGTKSGAKAPENLGQLDAGLKARSTLAEDPGQAKEPQVPRLAALAGDDSTSAFSRGKITKAEAWRLAVEAMRTVAI